MTDFHHFLTSLHPFDELSLAASDAILSEASESHFDAFQVIYEFGQKLNGLYVVMTGQVEISDELGNVISILGPGNSFGERGLFRDGLAVTKAKANLSTKLIMIPAELVFDLMKNEPVFRHYFDRQRLKRKLAYLEPRSTLATRPIRDLMTPKVETISPSATINEAATIMREKNLSCLIVEEHGVVKGIFSLRDLVYKALAKSLDASEVVEKIMTPDPVFVFADDIANEALIKMAQYRVNHLPVYDGGKLVGILTKSDLLARDGSSSMALVLQISKARTPPEMKEAVEKLPLILTSHAGAGTAPHITTRLLTDITDACTRRLIALFRQKNGDAPVPYVWAACGSQGRQEQTGVSDQDNVIIYQDGAREVTYFEALGNYVCTELDAIGYYKCPGNMMATNPTWCQPVSIWRKYFLDWINKPTGEAQMLASVMFDLRAIDGEQSILDKLKEEVLAKASQHSIFQSFMIANSLSHQPPLSLFRGFATIRSGEHKDRVDMKHNGVAPIIDLARIYAMKSQIKEVNTRKRLELSAKAGGISEKGAEDLISAYDYISELRLRHQMRQIREGQRPDNFLAPSSLTELERSHLRDAFVMVKSMQSAISSRAAG